MACYGIQWRISPYYGVLFWVLWRILAYYCVFWCTAAYYDLLICTMAYYFAYAVVWRIGTATETYGGVLRIM